jgi:alpha-glucoside transport system permease protein
MTNGNYGTNVLANLMYQQLFNSGKLGRASAIAVILLAAVIPVLIINVRRNAEQWAR